MNSYIYSLDKKLFLFLNGYHNEYLDKFMFYTSNMLMWIPFYVILLYFFVKHFKNNDYEYISLNTLLLVSIIVFQIIICVNFLPNFIQGLQLRESPCYNPEISSIIHLVGNACDDKYAFFTYRACTAFATSTFLFFIFFRELKWLKYLLLVWVILISYNRIYSGAHYPINVLVGDVLGALLGLLSYYFYDYIKNKLLAI